MNNLLVNALSQIGSVVMMIACPSARKTAAQTESFKPSAGCEFANFDLYNSQHMELCRGMSQSESYFLND